MKHWIYTIITLLLVAIYGYGQTPEGFTYQAVARDASGEILANQNVGMRFSIIQGSISGASIYTETHSVTSNSFGLINLEIGDGTTTDSFTAIDWSNGPYFIKVEMDATGGTSYAEFGTSQLLSVPYALHAKTAENTFSGNYMDLAGTPNIPSNVSDLANDLGFITDPADADSDPTNELQDISLSGTDLSISQGSTVDLSGLSFSGSETDPEVGANTLNYLSKWNGSSLVTSSVFDNGKIGIGNSDPTEILHITSTTTPNIRVDAPGNSGYYIGFNSAGYMAFSTVHSGISYFDAMILKEGRMGIGTITPTATLDIAGNLNLSGSNQFGTALIAESSLPHTGPHESVLMLKNASNDPSSEANLQFASGSPAHGRATISATHDIGAGLYNGILDLEIRNGTTSYIKALTIRSSGNVGIGNTDPLTKLDVGGVVTATGGNSDHWNEAFGWGNHADAGYLTSAGAETDPEVGANTLNYLSKWDGSALVSSSIYENGNVGIGTVAPDTKLHVVHSGPALTIRSENLEPTGHASIGVKNDVGRFFNWGLGGSDNTYPNAMYLYDSEIDGPRMLIDSDGNVGIGTDSPDHLLSVEGMIQSKVDGFRFPDGTVQTTAATGGSVWDKVGDDISYSLGRVYIGTTVGDNQLILDDVFPSGGKNLLVGDDAFLTDVDEPGLLGIYGEPDNTRGAIRLGSTGIELHGKNSRLGISTDNPVELLHLVSDFDPNIKVDGPGDNGFYIGFNTVGGYQAFSTRHGGTEFWETLNLKEGKVGIGTNDPQATLDINGDVRIGGKMESSGSNQYGTFALAENTLPHSGPHESVLMLQNASEDPASEANIQFAAGSPAHGRATISATHDVTAGTYNGNLSLEVRNGSTSYTKAVTIRSSGNVGIGTNDPDANLHVQGNTHVTGDLQVDGNIGGSFGMPAGVIVPFAGDAGSVPDGWLLCDGSELSRSTYANLFATIGINYGSGDNSTTFHLPDFRGRFMRGADNGAGNDPDIFSRTASNPGGNTGDAIGSWQAAATGLPGQNFYAIPNGQHDHTFTTEQAGLHHPDIHPIFHAHYIYGQPISVVVGPGVEIIGLSETPGEGLPILTSDESHDHSTTHTGSHYHDGSTAQDGYHDHTISGGDAETRPVNVSVNYIIKY